MVTTSLPNDPLTAQNRIAHAIPILHSGNDAIAGSISSAHVEAPPKKKAPPTPN